MYIIISVFFTLIALLLGGLFSAGIVAIGFIAVAIFFTGLRRYDRE